jgi:hypothetical protein
MREHCRTQHSFDPMPKPVNLQQNLRTVGQPQSVPGTNTTKPSAAAEKFLKMMRDCLTIQELGSRRNVDQVISDSFGSIDKALNYLTDNFVIMRKTNISGISAHVCDNCLTFQFQYIKNIGFDLTASERHRCIRPMVYGPNKLQDKITRQEQLRMQSYDSLTMLTNSIFMGNKYLVVDSTLTQPNLANLHLPLIKFDFITPDHWTWTPISRKIISLTETALNNYIMRMKGTFALISIESGVHSGDHLMYIKCEQ